MKPTIPWAMLAALPVGATAILAHEHTKRAGSVFGKNLKCVRHQTIIANARVHHGLSLHVFHDDRNQLWIVRTG